MSTHFEEEERTLLLRYFKNGDPMAFQDLFSRYNQKIWAFIHSKGVPEHQAEAVFQDTFLGFAKFLRKEVPQKALAVLFSIAKRKIADCFRKLPPPEISIEPILDTEPIQDRSHSGLQGEHKIQLEQLLSKSGMKANQREALWLHYGMGLSIPQAAQVLDAPANTVKSRIYLGKKKIQAYLQGGDF